MRKIRTAWTWLRYRGIGYLIYLATGYLLPRLRYYLFFSVPRLRLRRVAGLVAAGVAGLVFAVLSLLLGLGPAMLAGVGLAAAGALGWMIGRQAGWLRARREARARLAAARSAYTAGTFTSWTAWPVDPATRARVEAVRQAQAAREIVLGHIDGDGRVLSRFGALPGFEPVEEAAFIQRYRYLLDIVLVGEDVLIRKDYQGDRASLLREWRSLGRLYGKVNVPAVYRVEEQSTRLYKNLIAGTTINDLLVEQGARIRLAQTAEDPALAALEAASRIEAVLDRGARLVPSCMPEAWLEDMEQQIDRIHACGVAGFSLTYGNIVVDQQAQRLWFIDFDKARSYRSLTDGVFLYRRDQDRRTFNRLYGRRLLTEASVRAALAAEEQNSRYEPIDFGGGLTVGNFWSVDDGTGRWQVLNRRVVAPLVRGKQVLDLGSNNGLLPLLMLRDGAARVVGVERDPNLVARARLVHRLFEWRDLRAYAFEIRQTDVLEAARAAEEPFDVVTSFCSLYNLTPEAMAETVRRAADLAPVFIVQANDATRPKAADDKARKTSTAFLEQLLKDNGFPEVRVVAPRGYPRPLLVGTGPQPRPTRTAQAASTDPLYQASP